MFGRKGRTRNRERVVDAKMGLWAGLPLAPGEEEIPCKAEESALTGALDWYPY